MVQDETKSHIEKSEFYMQAGISAANKARDYAKVSDAQIADGYGAKAHGCFMQAQVEASLAIAEQLRLSNLITLAKLAGREDAHEELEYIAHQTLSELVEYKDIDLDDEVPIIPPGITIALGIKDANADSK